ncbi:hypothetical protein SYNPS1DRAFT_22434 [Syncephalis pseudoplumigaleata]|uniref:PCI domain-containing protein n=1 Tax=Syncephalis pseudoplumigaleata TaxID=1712513 RepID=A0A4P9Z083_9FUNG|nr:hypothetical protein SYNPS1DRAFT_22434 [Syncephalis pseudoplumigaleata]|eukprot:RKP25645.1 hypothetical protein SYNPS1DRAFT_22434 [Syncephalis pseudoplumigaleata]
MEVDLDVPSYLAEQRANAPDNLKPYFVRFEDLHERKLWHQLTSELERFLQEPNASPLLIPLFERFVADWEKQMDPLKLVAVAVVVADQYQNRNDAIQFLMDIASKVDRDETRQAHVQAVMEAAHYRLGLGDLDECKQAMDTCEAVLEGCGVQTAVNASFYRVCSDYYKAKADYPRFYKHALLFLACFDLNDLSLAVRQERAHDLAISALLGDTIYNFGDLLSHPILDSLTDTPHAWLRDLLFAFNAGDIGKFETLTSNFAKQPLLQANMPFLRQKICLMALIEAVFKRPPHARRLRFSDIATETRLPVEEVEHLTMKALSLSLIRGRIDQVDGIVEIDWVQPRYLEKHQIAAMREQLEDWQRTVEHTAAMVEGAAPELFVRSG